MSYKYTHFIPENIAPKGAKRIAVYKGNERICTVPLGRLAPVEIKPLYSFGLVSDVHLSYYNSNPATTWRAEEKLPAALQYFTDKGCAFCAHCGDLVNVGFYYRADYTGETWVQNDFHVYDTIRKQFALPIYGVCGNHENYGKNITDTIPTTINGVTKTMLEHLYDYTVEDGTTGGTAKLSYTVSHAENAAIPESDVFIFAGQPKMMTPLGGENGEESLDWLASTLAANKDKRCFIFIHSYLEEDSGDAGDVRENSIFSSSCASSFKNLLGNYPNAILFHGHSHMKFENQKYYDSTKPLDDLQESYKAANYTDRNRFKSVHVPSLSTPRYIDFSENKAKEDIKASEAYIVDVYDDCIVLRGMDMINKQQLPLGSYKINTTG